MNKRKIQFDLLFFFLIISGLFLIQKHNFFKVIIFYIYNSIIKQLFIFSEFIFKKTYNL